MTVAAVILAATAESALADPAGLARVRRIADAAWSGGALPIVVVAPDPDGAVAGALAGAPVTLAAPAPEEGGAVGQIARGIDLALAEVGETTAALVWPAQLCWVGPETVTSLIEAHGPVPGMLLRPGWRGEAGWPALVPLEALLALRALPPTALPGVLLDALRDGGLPVRVMDLGDPGAVIDGATPRSELPPYEGPAEPAVPGGREWGSAAATIPDDAPLAGPDLVRDPAG